jgi:acetoin utilization deacetylase AcuC-like enzyme
VGAVDEDDQIVFSEIVVPVLRQFKPDLVLVSAGFDAHERDPLAGMRLTTSAFGAMTMELRRVAEECCGGRLVAVTEGGYDLHAFAESLLAVVSVLGGAQSHAAAWPEPLPSVRPARGQDTVSAARKILGPFWKL